MTHSGVYGFPEGREAAERLAAGLELPCHIAELHRFPDGESLVRLPQAMHHPVIYRGLDQPNAKLIEIVLAAEALREQGAEQVTLVAPYLPYMRQDSVFRPGEPVSQKVIGRWLADHFSTIVAVDPHLHRTDGLAEVFAGAEAVAVSAASLFARALETEQVTGDTVVLAPDEEAEGLAKAVAEALGLACAVGVKERRGDREVELRLPEAPELAGRPVVIVDDVVSSGLTMIEAARAARTRGATTVEAFAVHALFDEAAGRAMAAAGVARLRSADGIPHPSNAFELAPLLALALRA